MRRLGPGVLILLPLVTPPCTVLAQSNVVEPSGYRLELYDAPVPPGLGGAITVSAPEVQSLQQEAQAVVIDVIPESRMPADLPADQLWMPVRHMGVPDALWLPDTGFGVLHPITARYFSHHLKQATADDRSRALVFYCRMDCWMSWNAAKRAMSLGYTEVYWFRDGIDDWLWEDFDVAPLQPAPGQRLPEAH